MFAQGGWQIVPKSFHLIMSQNTAAVDNLFTFQDFTDVFTHPLQFQDNEVLQFVFVLKIKYVAQIMQPLYQDRLLVALNCFGNHEILQNLWRDVVFGAVAENISRFQPSAGPNFSH